mgnify:FL=1
MEENMMKIKFSFTNQWGETFVTEREVPEDFLDMSEIEILNDTYKNFLNNLTFPVYDNQKIAIVDIED